MKFRFLLPLITVAILGLFFLRGLFLDPTEVPSPLIGKPVPQFDLPTLAEPEQRFNAAMLQGQPSLVNVFATWCAGCHTEHALLVELSQQLDVPIYGLNWKDDRQAALDWLQRDGNPYADVAFDEKGDVAIDWGVYGAPETFVIDAQGIVRYKRIGILTEEIVQEKILPLLEQLRQEAAAGASGEENAS